ncbi:MAG: GAF domain-containing protein, partial [Myxococcales bacterium]|nr:GAF domain-containing protein [Myxococcales bacterium]
MIREPDPNDAPTEPAPEGQLAKVLDYLAFVAKNRPLTVLLEEAPRRIADCIGADVASLYLMEGDGRSLVLRGNVGLPSWARGKVRLEVGEGITGRAVELRHPIAVSRAPDHASYREFPDLEETRFPAFLAVPIMGTAGPLGAFVVQREEGAFSEQEICLVTALTAPISSGLRLARLLDDLRARPRKGRGGTQRLTLTGVPVVRGRAMGAVAAVRRPTGNDPSASGSSGVERLDAAVEQVERALERLRRDHPQLTADQSSFLDSLDLMVQDQHLKRTARDQIESGATVAEALGAIAPKSIVKDLRPLLKDPVDEVRDTAKR